MGYVNGVNLLPSTGEFAYDTQPYFLDVDGALRPLNLYASGGTGSTTDYSIAIDNLVAESDGCGTVSLVIAWFGNSTDIGHCQIYPTTIFLPSAYPGAIIKTASGATDHWRCSGLTQSSPGLIPLPIYGSGTVYGGTPCDQSIVRCIRDLKSRGLRVVFYPFILMTATGYPWRGRMSYSGSDMSSAAATAVAHFLGPAATSDFTWDTSNLTVGYSGAPTDFTLRRMILHYANLCALAGGVDLFLIGSELRGLETIRGPAWTKAGTTGADGRVTLDYPFVDGLIQLADDVRSVFDGAGLAKDPSGLHNLIAYSADWSDWMGFQHPGENGQWPHLDQLFAHANIDLVSIDNYMPLSDWTAGDGGLDVTHWSAPKPDPANWPPAPGAMNGLGLSGTPTLYSKPYLKANIEGGCYFNWYYREAPGIGASLGLDPNGTDLRISLPAGDRLTQSRNAYSANQQLLANKQIRWWWNNEHHAIYDNGDGSGWVPRGPSSAWVAQSKSIIFAEYGTPACDRGTNQPNVFYDPKSTESFTPYWSIWDPAEGATYWPRRDDEIQLLALQAIYEYWVEDGNNETSSAGLKMLEPTFMSVWNWDARPFPTFPARSDVWGDTGNWRAGNWLSGKGPFLVPPLPDAAPAAPAYPSFPSLSGQGWSITYRPSFATGLAAHVSGRESRTAKMSAPLWEIELTFDLLRMDADHPDLAAIIAFYDAMQGQDGAFTFPVAASLGIGARLVCRFANDQEDLEEFVSRLWALRALKLRSAKW